MAAIAEKAKSLLEKVTVKTLVGRGVEIVTFIVSLFGGTFEKIAPPEETSVAFTLGIASTAALIVYFIVRAAARGRLTAKTRKKWFVVAVVTLVAFLGFAFKYNNDRDRLTFLWPPSDSNQVLKVAGETLTQEAQEARKKDPNLTSAQLVSGFGGIDARTRVWTDASIRKASTTLKVDYVLMFLSAAIAIFCTTEGILLRDTKRPAAD